MYYLGIDIGTSNIKVLVTDDAGKTVRRASATVSRCHRPDGAVEQDIFEIYSVICDLLKETIRQVDPRTIASVGIACQGGAIVPLDEHSLPVGMVISWLDTRGTDYDRLLTNKLGATFFAEHTGHPRSIVFPGQFYRLKAQNIEYLPGIKNWGFIGDVIVGMLTGNRVHDFTSLSICGLLNPRECRMDKQLLEVLGLDERQFAKLANASDIAGRISKSVSQQTTLPVGTPVSPAVHDQYAAAFGGGVVHPGDVMLATGTAWILMAVSEKLIPPIADCAYVCPHPVKGLFGQMITLGGGGLKIQQAMHSLGFNEFTPENVDKFLEDSSGPIYSTVVEWARKTSRYLKLIKDAGMETRHLIITGPAAQSRHTLRIVQEHTPMKVTSFEEPAASAYGAALIARKMHES